MNLLPRTRASRLFRHAISDLPAALLMVGMVTGCSQSSAGAGDTSDEGGTGSGSGGTGSSGSSGGSTSLGDDAAAGSSSGAASATSSGGGSGGSTDDSGTGGAAQDSGSGGDDAGGGAGHDAGGGAGHDAGGGAGHDAGGGAGHDAGGGTVHDAGGGGTVSTCTKNDAVCSADNTGCNVGSYYFYDNQWNCGGSTGNSCGPESAYGCANGDGTVSWVTTSNQAKGNTAVLSYPAMQDNFNSTPSLSSFSTISSTFTETSPNVGDYEVAWDCWFNSNANEFMVWVDTYNQVPAGPKVASNVSLGGRTWNIYWAPSGGGGGTVSFWATANFTSGTVDLLQLFNYGVSKGWLPSSSKMSQISFGTEVCSTNGENATWTVSNYSVTAH